MFWTLSIGLGFLIHNVSRTNSVFVFTCGVGRGEGKIPSGYPGTYMCITCNQVSQNYDITVLFTAVCGDKSKYFIIENLHPLTSLKRLALFWGLNSYGVFVPENRLQVSGGNFMIGTTCHCDYCDQINEDDAGGR